jgi:hypothetical protein
MGRKRGDDDGMGRRQSSWGAVCSPGEDEKYRWVGGWDTIVRQFVGPTVEDEVGDGMINHLYGQEEVMMAVYAWSEGIWQYLEADDAQNYDGILVTLDTQRSEEVSVLAWTLGRG